MASPGPESIAVWVDAVIELLAPYARQVRYGNVRSEHSKWNADGNRIENLAIVYEIPGGSTNQINIAYSVSSGLFSFLAPDTFEEHHTTSLDEVLNMVRALVDGIPALRHQSLTTDIDRWIAQGASRAHVFQKLNALLKFDALPGGGITQPEMQAAIAHAIKANREPR